MFVSVLRQPRRPNQSLRALRLICTVRSVESRSTISFSVMSFWSSIRPTMKVSCASRIEARRRPCGRGANAMRNNRDKYRAAMKAAARQILADEVTIGSGLRRLGVMAQGDVQASITSSDVAAEQPGHDRAQGLVEAAHRYLRDAPGRNLQGGGMTMLGVARAIDRLAAPLTLYRTQPATYVDHMAVGPAPVEEAIRGAIQPGKAIGAAKGN